jgi:hypothetical protein
LMRSLLVRTRGPAGDLRGLLVPLSSDEMEAYVVSTLVNSPQNDSVEPSAIFTPALSSLRVTPSPLQSPTHCCARHAPEAASPSKGAIFTRREVGREAAARGMDAVYVVAAPTANF